MKFPLLFTVAEPKSLYHHYHDQRGTTDVWKANYVQGENLDQDRLQGLTRISVYKGVEEYGIGWKDSRACWIRREEETLLVQPDRCMEPVEGPAQEARSASGRYRWRVNSEGACGPTCLEQFDQVTGEVRQLWSHARWAGVQMASDPNQDRLLWSYHGYHLRGGLNSWDPQQQANQILPSPFGDDFEHLSFAPDGSTIAFVHQNEVYTHRLTEARCRKVSNLKQEAKHLGERAYRLRPSWSPDGKRIFYTNFSFDWRGDNMLERYNLMVALPDGSERRLILENPAMREVIVGPPHGPRTQGELKA